MLRCSLVSLVLGLVLTVSISVPVGVHAAAVAVAPSATAEPVAIVHAVPIDLTLSDDPVSMVDAQLAAVPPLTSQSSPDAAAIWLDRVGEVCTRIATGGLPALPPSASKAVQTLGSQLLTTDLVKTDARIVAKATALLPSLWTMGFFYAKPETWQPILSSVTTPLFAVCKSNDSSYAALVNATSRIVRFTKDTVFLNGVDRGDAIANAADNAYLTWLAAWVSNVSTTEGFEVNATQLRAFMNTLPSKRDGMKTNVAFPVYVDTAKYEASDATALRTFLTTLPSEKAAPATTTQ